MKAFKRILLCLIIVIGFVSISVNGNSAQLKDFQPGSFNLTPVDKTDIYINHEDLLFDFTSRKLTNEFRELGAEVTATYEMINPGETKNVRMGFPYYVSYLNDSKDLDMSINANDNEVQSELYFKFRVSQDDLPEMTFEDALAGMVSENYRNDESLNGTLYTFKPTTNLFNVRIECDRYTKIIYNGFTSKRYTTENIEKDYSLILSFDNVNSDEDYWIFFCDGEIKLSVETKGASDYKTETISANDLIERYLLNKNKGLEEQTRGRATAIRLNFEKRVEDSGNHYLIDMNDFDDFFRGNFLVMMVYDVEMLGNSVPNTVSISYYSQASFNRKYDPTVYTISYLTNPAKNWADFKSLDITIIPPSDNEFVINTTLGFTRNDDGSYSLSLKCLPNENITFSVSSSENPKEKNLELNNLLIMLVILLPIIFFFLFAIIMAIVIYKIVKKSKKAKSST